MAITSSVVFLGVECIEGKQSILEPKGLNQLLGGLNLVVLVAIIIGDPDVAKHQRDVGGQRAQYLSGPAAADDQG